MNMNNLIYKCRQCGIFFSPEGSSSSSEAVEVLLKSMNNQGRTMFTLHPCTEDSVGIADLQGYTTDFTAEKQNDKP